MSFKSRVTSFLRYISGKNKSGQTFRLVIEITNNCNLKCKMCPRNTMTRPVSYMDKNLFSKIIDENHDSLEFVSLNGYGEPLLHPNLFEFIEICRKNKVPVGISTNCTLMTDDISRNLLERGPDQITLAIDSVEKQSYEKVRKGASYEVVMHNVTQFLAMRKKIKSSIFIVLQCIFMTETKKQIRLFQNKFKKLCYDAIRIRQLTYSGKTRKDASYRNKSCKCFWLWYEPMVLCDGTVVACCQDINGNLEIGNLNQSKLSEIWRGEHISKIRAKHASGERDSISICKACNMYQPGIFIGFCASLFNTQILNRLLPTIESLISKLRYK